MNATMDPIESFIQSNRKFSISLLMNSHARLSILQMNKGGLTFEDILQSLYVQGQTMNTIELNSHAMLILGILVPALTTKGQIKLQMQREIVGNDSGFIKSILNLIYLKCGNVEYPFVEEFKMDAIAFLKYKQNLNRFNQFGGNLAGSFEGGWHDGSHGMIQRPMDGNSIMANGGQRKSAAVSKIHSVLVPDSDLPDDHKPSASRIELEKSEPIVRLLAQVRKVGMDVLFPQSTHDKVRVVHVCQLCIVCSSSTFVCFLA